MAEDASSLGAAQCHCGQMLISKPSSAMREMGRPQDPDCAISKVAATMQQCNDADPSVKPMT